MKLVMLGTGYVGLVSGTCFADSGNEVTCVDINEEKVARLLKGEVPIYEPGLTEMIQRNVKAGRLKFTTDASTCVPQAQCVFIAVGTPQGPDGSADLQYVLSAAKGIAPHLAKNAVVVTKSTVPVGTNRGKGVSTLQNGAYRFERDVRRCRERWPDAPSSRTRR